MKRAIGIALVASPFVAMTAVMATVGGWQMVAAVWGFVILLVGVIVLGLYLIEQGKVS